MKKPTYIALAVIAVLVVGGLVLAQSSKIQTGDTVAKDQPLATTSPAAAPATPAAKTELTIGRPDAPATIIEYGDFKCPSCNRFHHQAGKDLRQAYVDQGKLKVVYRTMDIIGPDSKRAAIGAYCAQDQGKFAAYHDAVYDYLWDTSYAKGDYSVERKDVLTEDRLVRLASNKGLDGAALGACLKTTLHDADLATDASLSTRDGVQGTPTFIIASQKIAGPQPYAIFKRLVDIQLQ